MSKHADKEIFKLFIFYFENTILDYDFFFLRIGKSGLEITDFTVTFEEPCEILAWLLDDCYIKKFMSLAI